MKPVAEFGTVRLHSADMRVEIATAVRLCLQSAHVKPAVDGQIVRLRSPELRPQLRRELRDSVVCLMSGLARVWCETAKPPTCEFEPD